MAIIFPKYHTVYRIISTIAKKWSVFSPHVNESDILHAKFLCPEPCTHGKRDRKMTVWCINSASLMLIVVALGIFVVGELGAYYMTMLGHAKYRD